MDKDKKIRFTTFEKFNGRKDIGSSRIRDEWLCNHWENAEIFKQGESADVMIYQKAYWIDHQECYLANESLLGARNTANGCKIV